MAVGSWRLPTHNSMRPMKFSDDEQAYTLFLSRTTWLKSEQYVALDLGMELRLRKHYFCHLTHSLMGEFIYTRFIPGIIDSDYDGRLKAMVRCKKLKTPVKLYKGTPICCATIKRYYRATNDRVGTKRRNTGNFGSSLSARDKLMLCKR